MEEDIVNDYKINGKKSLDRVKLSIENLREFFAGNRAETITTDRIKSYVREAQAEGFANASINRDLSALRRMFNLSIQAGRCAQRPYIPMLRENNARTGFFEADEFLALIRILPEYLKPMITFAYYTGWRRREILGLKWNQVDLHEKISRLNAEQAKNGTGRLVAVDGELAAILQEQYEARKVIQIGEESPTFICPYVFHNRGKPIRDFRAAWDSALKRAKLSSKIFHDLRRTAVRNMVRAGVPERVAMISGHKTRSVFDRYNIVSEEDLRDAAKKTAERIQVQRSVAKIVPITHAANGNG
jgi:integrase